MDALTLDVEHARIVANAKMAYDEALDRAILQGEDYAFAFEQGLQTGLLIAGQVNHEWAKLVKRDKRAPRP